MYRLSNEMGDWCFGPAGQMTGWAGFGIIFMILVLVLAVAGIIGLFRVVSRQPKEEHEKSALEILKNRYALGEIDQKQFDKMKKNLEEV